MDDVSRNTTDDVSHNTTDVSRNTTGTTVDVATAAERLGISEEAVRARIRRGKLQAKKVGALWRVYLPEGESTTPAPTPRDITQQPVTQQGTTGRHVAQHDTTPPATDLAPLVEMVREQNQRIEQLSAAAAMWQTRALHLEEQMRQLSATVERDDETVERPETSETGDHESAHQRDNSAPQGGVWARLMRWWKG